MAERRAAAREGTKRKGGRGGCRAGSHLWCDLRGEKYTRRSALVARVAAQQRRRRGYGGKVGKKCAESGLDRYPGVGHLLNPRR